MEAGPEGVRVWRGGEIESLHQVDAAVVDAGGGVVASRGDPGRRAYLRSAAKPVQLLPLVEEGLVDRYGFSPAEIAVMAASHNAEPFHLEAVERILAKAGLAPELLQCGPHPPLDAVAAEALRRSGREPTPLHNNCSGKHAGMLALCRAMDWPLDSYLDPGHPLQQRIWRLVAELAGLPPEAVGRGTDGCGVPAFAMPVAAMALMFARLAAGDAARASDRERAVGVVLDAMAAHPEYVAGTGRACTAVLGTAGERVVVKTGAEGVYCAALRGRGQGLALKVVDGAKRAQDVALIALLAALAVLDPDDPAVAELARPAVTNRAGVQVGVVDARLPLERPV